MADRISAKMLASKVAAFNERMGYDAIGIGGAYGHTHVESKEGSTTLLHGTKREAFDYIGAMFEGRQFTKQAEREANAGYTNHETLHFSLIADNDRETHETLRKLSEGDIYEAAERLREWFTELRDELEDPTPNTDIAAGAYNRQRTRNQLAMTGHPNRINWMEIVGQNSDREYLGKTNHD